MKELNEQAVLSFADRIFYAVIHKKHAEKLRNGGQGFAQRLWFQSRPIARATAFGTCCAESTLALVGIFCALVLDLS